MENTDFEEILRKYKKVSSFNNLMLSADSEDFENEVRTAIGMFRNLDIELASSYDLLLATGNKNKIREIKEILSGLNIEITSVADFETYPKTIEDGLTLKDNAIKKAKEAALYFEKYAMADDTGLEVEYLNGAPGVYSARYAGENCSYKDNNEKLLKVLSGVSQDNRKACFKCVIALSDPQGEVIITEGKIDGFIAQKETGENGFGYDPIFWVPGYSKTFAELDSGVKNKISHRAQAIIKMKEIIERTIVGKMKSESKG